VNRRFAVAVVCILALCGAGAAAADSPKGGGSTLANVESKVDRIERMIRRMERTAERWRRWTTCITKVPVSEYGDPDHSSGFAYEEEDGSGPDTRPALAIDRRGPRSPNMVWFEFSQRPRCQDLGTEPTQPGTPGAPGTADPAKVAVGAARAASLGSIERRLDGLERREERLERMAEQFDDWESCLSWIPVTEYGDPDGGFGYLFRRGSGDLDHRDAIAIDRSEWDDPDYMILGGELARVQFRGDDESDSPSAPTHVGLGRCNDEPGESVDRPAIRTYPTRRDTTAEDRIDDLVQSVDSFVEDVTDLGEPVEEFDTFDQCMHLIGMTQRGRRSGTSGYVFGPQERLRPALAMDMRGLRPPQYQFLAFPGEEPPSIECNEDAGGLFTN
jgi:hypothetical protein